MYLWNFFPHPFLWFSLKIVFARWESAIFENGPKLFYSASTLEYQTFFSWIQNFPFIPLMSFQKFLNSIFGISIFAVQNGLFSFKWPFFVKGEDSLRIFSSLKSMYKFPQAKEISVNAEALLGNILLPLLAFFIFKLLLLNALKH